MDIRQVYEYNDADYELVEGKINDGELIQSIKAFAEKINVDEIYSLFINKDYKSILSLCEYLKLEAEKIGFTRFVKDYDYITAVINKERYELVHYALSKLDMDQQCLDKSLQH